jgi:acyl-CoA synthetase (AMP-forming)/AMP-acid ligase II
MPAVLICSLRNLLQVLEAAVIAVPSERWGERPLLIVVPKQGAGEQSVITPQCSLSF